MALIFIPGLAPLTISGTPTTSGTAGSPITPFTVVGNGGMAPRLFSLVGVYPPGASIDAVTGDVTPGTPPEAGSFVGLSVRVTDALDQTADLPGYDLTVSAGGDFPVWYPTAPSGDRPLDFASAKDGHYGKSDGTANFVSLTTADWIDDTSHLTGGTGLVLTTPDAIPNILGNYQTNLLAANFTRVIAFTLLNPGTPQSGVVSAISDSDDNNEVVAYFNADNTIYLDDYNAGSDGRNLTSAPAVADGTTINILAFTRTQAKLVLSLNGADIFSDDTPFVDPIILEGAGYGSFYNDGTVSSTATVTIISDAIYAPQPDADLPTLST